MFNFNRYSLFLLIGLFSVQSFAQIKIVTTIKPLHSIIKNIVDDAEVVLLLNKNVGPHDYVATPSQILKINQATLLIYIDDSFEIFINRTLNSLSNVPYTLKLLQIKNLKRLDYRQTGDWQVDKNAAHEHESDHHHEAGIDPHIWLDPDNLQVIATAIAEKLGQIMPNQAQKFINNATNFNLKVAQLNNNMLETLEPVRHLPFIVFHDSYQYFERAYSLNAVSSMTLVPNEPASVDNIKNLIQKINQQKISCLFTEPQYNSRLVRAITQKVAAEIALQKGLLDPLGVHIKPGRQLIFQLYSNLAQVIKKCLD